ncbi:MAG: hypothetical protein WBM50_25450 [Acidimicrobiales bacterium]
MQRLDPIWRTIAPSADSAEPTPGRSRAGGTAQDGYLHCGPNGAGHFVKMVHNGIEYGMMAAIAEGLGQFTGKVLSAMRGEFGGHAEKSA